MQITPSPRQSFIQVQVTEEHINVNQELIHITEDRLRLITNEYLESLSRSGGWVTPASIFLSILATFCTSKFDAFLSFSPDYWRSLFTLVGASSFIWFVCAAIRARFVMTVNQFVNKVKNKV